MKRNKTKIKTKTKFKIIIYMTLFILTFITSIKYLDSINFSISNEQYLRNIIEDSNHFMTSTSEKRNITYYVVTTALNIDLDPISIFNKQTSKKIDNTDSDNETESNNSQYINDPYPQKQITNPTVYIYNTHQLEEYANTNTDYSITPNVMMASYILREKLYSNGINAIVEDNNVKEILNLNSWNYAASYKVTRMFLEEAVKQYPTLNYFIDLHRDSVSKKISTTTIDGKNYAKILFIIGMENENYNENLKITEKLNNMLEENYPTISRGIYKKQGAGVNGVYNQDFNKNTILIEIGGNENTIDEVLNTTIAISEVLTKYIKEDE